MYLELGLELNYQVMHFQKEEEKIKKNVDKISKIVYNLFC